MKQPVLKGDKIVVGKKVTAPFPQDIARTIAERISYDRLPAHTAESARLYIEHGCPPGSFLEAILRNQLVESYSRADETNLAAMFDIVMWLYNDCPMAARGENVDDWIEHGGLFGYE